MLIQLLRNTTSIVIAIRQTAPLVACLSALSECIRQNGPVVFGVDFDEPVGVGEIGFDNVLWIDEEVLGGSRDTGIFVAELHNELVDRLAYASNTNRRHMEYT